MGIWKFLDIFLPSSCEFCGRHDFFSSKIGVCKLCHNDHRSAETFQGSECGICKEWNIETECSFCFSRNLFFEELRFLRSRTPFLAKVINYVKFQSVYLLSVYLCLGIKRELASWKEISFSGIIVMPSTETRWYQRKKKRPFESCDFALKRMRTILPFPLLAPVAKISREKQAGKSYAERFIHARLAFQIKEEYKGRLKGDYLLLDDVFTTGASANELARILLENGADSVRVLTLIRTEGKGALKK
ncbi:ComF family protein [Leptospira adleri]|uniref:Amidophosphoribosyltransferase n=1 Tax=Leptospira adleri TaxID=2023186 RepID=A0A2M9YQZ6_9LEPT|nr:ComF family protein [Leptospira adleri]PJZ53947.1 amidophosphoribosyltransferase [Leptospira adleri]PJZ62035.1 amidophosphoribosyltransferase [Leptospira adleri]